LQEPLPEDPPWWELFKVKKEDMYAVAREVQALFSMPKVAYISVHRLLQGPLDGEDMVTLWTPPPPPRAQLLLSSDLYRLDKPSILKQ